MNNKQRWMGGVVLLGGGVLLAALLLKGKEEIHKNEIPQPVEAVQQNKTEPEVIQLQPLTVDVETEKRLLEEQRRAREKAVAEQESRAAEYLRTQQEAEAEAARRAAEEYAAMNARKNSAQQSSDNIPPELIEDEAEKKKRLAEEQRLVEQKKAAEQKAKDSQKSMEDKRKAEAEKLAADKKAAEKKAAEEKRKTDEAKKKAEADKKVAEERKAAEEKKRKAAEEEKKKTEAEKARDLLENGERQWMVQVALAANEANADALSAKLRAKGYKVTKSPTSKGVRIMVGPSKDRETADAMRKKINADSSLNMKSAWVIDWVPLDRR